MESNAVRTNSFGESNYLQKIPDQSPAKNCPVPPYVSYNRFAKNTFQFSAHFKHQILCQVALDFGRIAFGKAGEVFLTVCVVFSAAASVLALSLCNSRYCVCVCVCVSVWVCL